MSTQQKGGDMREREKEREENRNRKRRAGFTLVELLVVITILGILAAVAVVNVVGYLERANITATRTSIGEISKAVNIFAMDHNGKLPDNLDELTQGTNEQPPLLPPNALNDAWGTPFNYSKQGKQFTITSAGPDLAMGSEDDITNK
jgi:general secretion pathway protein G